MVMWGLNKSNGNNLINQNKTDEELLVNDTFSSSIIKDISSEERYVDIINQLEPDSRINMIKKSISLGIPASFVVGYFDLKDEDREFLIGKGLGEGCEIMINKHLFNSKVTKKVLVVSETDSSVKKLETLVGKREFILIKNLDELIFEMENDLKEITVLFDNKIPKDIEENIDLLVSSLESVEGIHFIEIGNTKYFKNSLSLNSFADIDDSSIEETDVEIKDVENKILINSQNKNKEIEEELKVEISKYKKLYAENSNELEDLSKKLDDALNQLEIKTTLLNETQVHLSNGSIDTIELIKEKENEIKSLKIIVKDIESEITNTRDKYSKVEVEIDAQKELLKDKNKLIKQLKETIEEMEVEKIKISEETAESLNSKVDKEVVKIMEENLDQKTIEVNSLNDQVRSLRVDVRKEIQERFMMKEELDQLNVSYKELLNKGTSSIDTLDEIFLGEELETQIFYFKVINQPPYFKSFMENFIDILSQDKKVLTVMLREEDLLSNLYFDKIKKINTLEDVSSSDKFVWIKPSKIMLVKEAEFYNQFDYVIVIDYLRNKTRYLKGDYVTPIHVFMNEIERDLLGVKGMILSGGETSVVDLRYDKNFELAKTGFIRKKYIKKKVMDWLQNFGIQ
jgi:hypothetical protein